ncbi:MAG: formate dehydrogenase accessory sulfurtransferase FdhD [Deltaproteobacteria bacterium]|nr:MAG: formate dehydrogenase accessory sulfurtransferase FdhD [Deltaproteobacteria bacterium]
MIKSSTVKRDLQYLEISSDGARHTSKGSVAIEHTLTIFVNGNPWVTLFCSPSDLTELALGFLESEGVLKDMGEVEDIVERQGNVWLKLKGQVQSPAHAITSGGGRSSLRELDLDPVPLSERVKATRILELARRFEDSSEVWKVTHGVHSAALSDTREILVFREDLGRHNAVDKVFGHCLMKGSSPRGLFLFLSGRISSEMVLKAARRKVPLIASLASPTDKALELAQRLNITVVGSARDERMRVYTVPRRIL